ncbi:terminase large subunit [Delftia tsuruhatensis]|uniref:terminase large subunit n=1 Tax=Delftia tsuruhatensis TaxID=180282 RepID=UPI00062D5C07|nr:terminase large subunit [Delftia tsuruhatensis]WEL99683.1 terminase large subunit [Delftia tsuruhatensis]WQM82151.1 terminase large subunit [Delftia tsuruhatensis]
MEWTTACPDWERRIVASESLIISPPLFPEVADEAWEICSSFVLTDIPGHPTIGQVARPWLRDLVRTIFGAEGPEGRRLINEYFLMVSKKNAKSTIAAAIMLTALLMNWRDEAELLILSPTIEVAGNSYKPISAFIKADEDLQDLLKVQDYHRLVTHRETNSTLKVVAADEATVTGKKASFVFVDELHEFGKKGRASNMLLEATGGLASRPEGFVIYATTQSEEPPAGVFKDKLAYARGVRDGEIKDQKFLPLIYEFPKPMLKAGAHKDLANAYVTNPNWGASVDIERIHQLHSQAAMKGEIGLKEFWAKHLNVEIGMNMRADRWAGADFWEQRGDRRVTLEYIKRECEVVVVGLDGGGLDDLLGLAVEGRLKGSTNCVLRNKAWIHPIGIERRKSEESKYLDFERDGDLVIVKRPGQDLEEVAAICKDLHDAGLLARIGLDPERTHKVVYQALIDAGIPEELIIGISQGWKLTGAMAVAERGLEDGSLTHAAQPLMAWCVGNAKVEPKGNASLITKQASGSAKIDPLMASLNAVTLMATNPQAAGGRSFWDK